MEGFVHPCDPGSCVFSRVAQSNVVEGEGSDKPIWKTEDRRDIEVKEILNQNKETRAPSWIQAWEGSCLASIRW